MRVTEHSGEDSFLQSGKGQDWSRTKEESGSAEENTPWSKSDMAEGPLDVACSGSGKRQTGTSVTTYPFE